MRKDMLGVFQVAAPPSHSNVPLAVLYLFLFQKSSDDFSMTRFKWCSENMTKYFFNFTLRATNVDCHGVCL